MATSSTPNPLATTSPTMGGTSYYDKNAPTPVAPPAPNFNFNLGGSSSATLFQKPAPVTTPTTSTFSTPSPLASNIPTSQTPSNATPGSIGSYKGVALYGSSDLGSQIQRIDGMQSNSPTTTTATTNYAGSPTTATSGTSAATPPVMTADGLSQSVAPVTTPPPPTNTATPSLQGYLDQASSGITNTFNNTQGLYNSSLGDYLNGIMGQKSQSDYQGQYYTGTGGVDDLQKQNLDLNNSMLAEKQSLNNQYNAIYNNTGVTKEQADQQYSEASRVSQQNQANIAIQQSVASGNYNFAKEIADRAIGMQMQQQQNNLSARQAVFNSLQSQLTTQQQEKFQSDQTALQANVSNFQDKQTQIYGIATTAAQNSADPTTVGNILNNLKTNDVGSAIGAANNFLKQGNYQVITDPNTGTPRLYNTKTGQFSDNSSGSGTSGVSGGGSSTVSTPSGQQYNLSTYATDPSYGQKITSIIGTIGPVTSAQAAQNIISSSAPNSPITGDMIINAAQNAGVDPTLLTAQLKLESGFGTTGTSTSNTNYGGIKYVGQANATQGTKSPDGDNSYYANFKSPQDALNTQAAELARCVVTNQGSSQNSSISTGQPQDASAAFTTLQQSAPTAIAGALGQVASVGGGGTYIDLSKLPATANGYDPALQARLFSKQHDNIPLLSADQVASLKATDEAIRNLTQVVAPAWQQIAPSGTFGKVRDALSQSFGQLGDSNFYANNKAYSDNKESLAQQIKALSGGSPRQGLLETAAGALPSNDGYSKGLLGLGNYDTLKDGNLKLQRTLELLNQSVATYLPNAQPATLGGTQTGGITVTDPNGGVHSFQDQASANAFKQAIGQ